MESSGIRLRCFQPSDFETLYRIDHACFPLGIAYGRLEMTIHLRAVGSFCAIAEIPHDPKPHIAGFILTERTDSVAHIITLDVVQNFRRRKIGSSLLEAAEQNAISQHAKRMVLETATTNQPAIALWEKHGYRQVVTIKNYYGPGLNAFEMWKQLDPELGAEILR